MNPASGRLYHLRLRSSAGNLTPRNYEKASTQQGGFHSDGDHDRHGYHWNAGHACTAELHTNALNCTNTHLHHQSEQDRMGQTNLGLGTRQVRERITHDRGSDRTERVSERDARLPEQWHV